MPIAPNARQRWRAFFSAPQLLAVFALACESAYPLEPTFCDDWCRALRKVECAAEPDRCVRNCERGLASADCLPLQEALLACYERARASDFVCAGSGWRSNPRPRPGVCEAERDALVGCEYPEVRLCFDRCRASLVALDAGVGGDGGGPDAGSSDAPDAAAQRCLPENLTCENFCWDLIGLASSLTDGGTDFSLDQVDTVLACVFDPAATCDADAGRTQRLEALFTECVLNASMLTRQ